MTRQVEEEKLSQLTMVKYIKYPKNRNCFYVFSKMQNLIDFIDRINDWKHLQNRIYNEIINHKNLKKIILKPCIN